jgi:3-oxoacyl-[acyl-carrier protein] reductase
MATDPAPDRSATAAAGRSPLSTDTPAAPVAPVAPVALVTGGAGGLGSVIATHLAERGTRVAVGYRTSRTTAERLAASLPDAIAVELDVTDSDSVSAGCQSVRDQLGAIAILVNCAGITRDSLSIRMTSTDWQDVIETNLSGPFRCAKQVLPGMLAKRFGRIVTIGSVSSTLGPPGQANYAAAKAGLAGMTKTLSREVARRDITVNVVAPGLVHSPLTETLDPALREQYLAMTATGREVEPHDVARAVLFCVDCPSLTGQVINIDGGVT